VLPETDHWLISAATYLIIDLFTPIATMVLVAAYFAGLQRAENELGSDDTSSPASMIVTAAPESAPNDPATP
jgi:hypothetical protein